MMRAYLNVVTPRPPGNIHARQVLAVQALPQAGELVRSSIRCLGKEMRRDAAISSWKSAAQARTDARSTPDR